MYNNVFLELTKLVVRLYGINSFLFFVYSKYCSKQKKDCQKWWTVKGDKLKSFTN